MQDDLTAEELKSRVKGIEVPLTSLIASLPDNAKPEGRAYGLDMTFGNGDAPPWSGEWDNHFDK